MLLFALSFQEQVEKYGVYVGIAAFFGLAVLSLLYFSQARELKRLREWAGRAPERARELEQRVVAQASASAARRTPAMPGAKGGMAPPRRLAEMPAPQAAAQTAAGAQATELADAVPAEDEPATNGNVPAAPAPSTAAAAGAANGAAPPAEAADGAAVKEPEEQAEREERPEQAADETPEQRDETAESEAAPPVAPGAVAAAAATAGPAAANVAGSEDAAGRAAGSEDAAGGAAGGEDAERTADEDAEGTAVARAGDGEPERTGDDAERAADEDAEPAAAARPGEVPPAVPRATPAQRVGAAPRAPAPLPLRQTRPSATPASGRGAPPRRPGAPAQRRPPGAPREGRSAGTIALFVGLAVLVLGGGAFAVSQLGGDDAPPAPNRAAPPPTQTDADTGEGGGSAAAKTAAETNVAVLNGTTFTGLAGQLADRVSQQGGFERGAVETNTRDQTIQTSTIFYADGFRSQARKVGELLSISSIESLDADTQALAPDADVVVLAGADQAP